ncbi:regulator of telomere elongation helicase 1 homolog [Tribolium madens]|uniref:regulator of telomere elongation helicase 1 homolog n=1 Tax=Tribolium madens TaxID=41895 RepID=UPI001CF7308C|nr:regulator of telomere elongation helicase 1 homolog [Tribolium madens]
MSSVTIRGIPVNFPYTPYDIQVNYMEKVLECLQDRQNGVLESPTGTGKTLSLLCASLAWLEVKKAQVQAHRLVTNDSTDFLKELNTAAGGQSTRSFLGMPTIIYASRTHSQLSQAMQELKRTNYNHMKATVLGSREQMCVHQEVLKEKSNAMKVHLCRLKLRERSCHFYNNVDRKKEDPAISQLSIVDIEDLVKLGQSHKFCPYYMAKELKQNADIVFTPYNYLLDPKVRKALGLELTNNVIILDEGHNIEKICEDSASIQIKSTDIALCIDEVTAVMKALSDDVVVDFNDKEVPKDFTAEELCILKEIFLNFEKVLDEIEVKSVSPEGTYFEGNYIFEMFNKAGINDGNYASVLSVMDKIIQFLAAGNEGPFARKGVGLQLFSDLLTIAFSSISPQFKEKIRKSYKVHIAVEEGKKRADDWLSKATLKSRCRVLSYWCFSPGFGMNMLLDQGVHCVILTSGTLAPLKPLISELELNVGVRIENPHIVKGDQVCVKILTKGPDGEALNCNYQNRDNPNYLMSLGQVVSNLIRIIPNGVLIFFPSYPIMQKCQQHWQQSGIWDGINKTKAIFVEPKDKNSFTFAMSEYYSKIKDPTCKGAIFMGVCRGKVSEGLDFADINGRAVFIIGLPYPPLKDPKIILKKRYLDTCNAKDKEYLKGDDWYSLEATRAINQAIGRVIRHKDDYGAIILLDSRFTNPRVQANLSLWLKKHIKVMQNFGTLTRDLRLFFQNAQTKLPVPKTRDENTPPSAGAKSRVGNFDFSSSSISLTPSGSSGLVNIHKRKTTESENPVKKMKITVIANRKNETPLETSISEFIIMVKKALPPECFKKFINLLTVYRANCNLNELKTSLDEIFLKRFHLRYIIKGLEPYIKDEHKSEFREYCDTWLEVRKAQFNEQSTCHKCGSDSPQLTTLPRIIYASRTHTQLSQAMQEMKRTAYNHLKACVLGSREQMCIDPEVIEEKNASVKVNLCRTKVKRKQCKYHQRVERASHTPPISDLSVVDIEDVVTLGRQCDFCPYHMARELKTKSDVVFMPYNYLLDPRTSKNMDVEINANVIIFDEAHNIEKICEESVSVQIKSTDVDSAIEDIATVIEVLTNQYVDVDTIAFTTEELQTLSKMLIIFNRELNGITLYKLAQAGTIFDGDYIFEIFKKAEIHEDNNRGISELIEGILDFISTTRFIHRSGFGLQIFNNLLFIAYYKRGQEFRQKIKESFKVQVEDEKPENLWKTRYSQKIEQKESCRVLNFWCFSPGFAMNMLMDRNIHCVILTSGTLAPLKPLISELELDIGVRIENPHIVQGDQVCVKILSKGPDMEPLNSNFQNRANPKYLRSLGLVISNLIRVIPDGVLIFFPSYIIMQKTIEHWQDDGIWDSINRIKPIYVEPKDKISFATAMSEYYAKIQDPSYSGAIFMGVCRGKVSEGLDFADINGRAVFITGLPYPPLKDPKIILKKQYLDFRHSKNKDYLKGDDWYNLEATRAINQAIGRVIRHKDDFGAIILLDSRFTNPRIKNNLSLWLRQHITDMKNFGEIIRNVRVFFQNAQKFKEPHVKEIVIEPLVEASTSSEGTIVKINSRKGEPLECSTPKKNR